MTSSGALNESTSSQRTEAIPLQTSIYKRATLLKVRTALLPGDSAGPMAGIELPKMKSHCDLKETTQPMPRAMTAPEAPPGSPPSGSQAPGFVFNKDAAAFVPQHCEAAAPPGWFVRHVSKLLSGEGLLELIRVFELVEEMNSGGTIEGDDSGGEERLKEMIQEEVKMLHVRPKARPTPSEAGCKKAEQSTSRKLMMSNNNWRRCETNKSGEECGDVPGHEPLFQFQLEQAAHGSDAGEGNEGNEVGTGQDRQHGQRKGYRQRQRAKKYWRQVRQPSPEF